MPEYELILFIFSSPEYIVHKICRESDIIAFVNKR